MGAPTIPHQLDVYFHEFPEFNARQLQDYINSCDPDEPDKVKVELVKDETKKGLRLLSFTATMGEFALMGLIHSVPSPDTATIPSSRLPQGTKSKLENHRCFALLTNMGGAKYAPYEAEIFLYKVAVALCQQEAALGVGNVHTGVCLPQELLNQIAKGVPGGTIWKALRSEGEPMEMLATVLMVPSVGANWLVTRGFAQCGFPNLAFRVEPGDNLKDVVSMYSNIFTYFMQNGPVIEAGHTMGHDKNVAFRFNEPPPHLKFPFETWKLLVVSRERTERKKFLGLF